jgi:hypothetical protein
MGRTALPVAVLGVAGLLSLIVGVFLMDWAPAARLGEGGVERWIAYPVVLWMVSFGASLAAARAHGGCGTTRSAGSWQPAMTTAPGLCVRDGSAEVERAAAYGDGESPPFVSGEGKHRACRVLAVAHRDDAAGVALRAGHRRNLDAGAAVAAAVTTLAPPGAVYAVHRSSATFPIRSREAPRGRASARSRSNANAALPTSADFSIV